MREFIDPLFAAVPKIKVIGFGYDILFWDYFEVLLVYDPVPCHSDTILPVVCDDWAANVPEMRQARLI